MENKLLSSLCFHLWCELFGSFHADGIFFNPDFYIRIYFNHQGGSFYLEHAPMQSAYGNNFITFFDSFAVAFFGFGFPHLGANHKKVKDDKN